MNHQSPLAILSTLWLVGLLAAGGCGGEAVVDGVANADNTCDASSCPDGYCNSDHKCVTRAQICARACKVIPVCMTSGPKECYDFCFTDLSDCGAQQMAATDACTDHLESVCNADEWLECIQPISCLETE